MIEKLEQLYIDGFYEDGVNYAKFFCKENFNNAVFSPVSNPVSCGYLIEREMKNATKIGYLSALSTKKEYRGLGFASVVVHNVINEANKRKYPFVVLGPFSPTYYKKFGFFDFDNREKRKIVGGNVIAKYSDKNDVERINDLFSSNSFACDFNLKYYKKLEREAMITGAQLFTLYEDNKIVGFCVKGDNFISNVISKDGAIGRCQEFLGNEYLENSETGQPFLQMRITNLNEFLKLLIPSKEFSVSLKISDCIVEDNNLILQISNNGNRVECKITNKYELELDIKDVYEFLTKNDYVKKVNSEFIDNY